MRTCVQVTVTMDAKDLRTESALNERNNDGSKYSQSGGIALHCDRNKSYQDIGSNSLAKVDVPSARPCAVIGPDRVVPPPAPNEAYLKKGPPEPWPCMDNVYHARRPPDYPHKLGNFQNPTRNISPRQTFQENMQRIMVPPSYNSVKLSDESNYTQMPDRANALSKNIKLNVPPEAKFCEVPYTVYPNNNDQKNVRTPEMCLPSANPNLTRTVPHGWPPGSVNIRPTRTYGAPEIYPYQDYPSCAGPRPAVPRPNRTVPEDPAYVYADPFYHQEGNVRFKPYPTVKERFPQQRYEYIGNYPNSFHPNPAFPSHKYDIQKPMQPLPYQPYPSIKYLDRVPEPIMEGYQRNQQSNYNLPYRNQMMHPNYGPVLGNCTQNKIHSYPPDAHIKAVGPNKVTYDNNKAYIDYENGRPKMYTQSESYLVNEMGRMHPMKSQVIMPNYPSINMHNIPPNTYYKKDSQQIKNYEYIQAQAHYRNMDPNLNIHNSMIRHPPVFSPNTLAISPTDSSTSNDNSQTLGASQEDCGYVSQSSTASVRSVDSGINRIPNDYLRKYYDNRFGTIIRNPPMMSKSGMNSNNSSKEKKNIDVRQFLSMWNEGDEEAEENHAKEIVVPAGAKSDNFGKSHDMINQPSQEHLYVLGLVNVPSEELGKYEHIQKVSKLPENIKGYNHIELLNQFEEAIESSNITNYKPTTPLNYPIPPKGAPPKQVSGTIPPRPLSPLDVEAKISQSVIHKEVGCNFEIKPCSPKMLNVEVATPVQNILAERAIERVANPVMLKSPRVNGIDENIDCDIIKRQEHRLNINNEPVRIPSCKMVKTQFPNNNTIEPLKNSYSLQDLESSSGLCLASLPRLDNDIELNFPEVNQQFINANKSDSTGSNTLQDLPNLEALDSSHRQTKDRFHDKNTLNQNKNTPKSPCIVDSEKESSKLSKYRKSKTNTIDSKENLNAVRTDSVIIKNPENAKNYEDCSTFSPSSVNKHTNDIQQVPINLTSQVTTINNSSNTNISKESTKQKEASAEIAIDFSLSKNTNDHLELTAMKENKEIEILNNTNISTYSELDRVGDLPTFSEDNKNILTCHRNDDKIDESIKLLNTYDCNSDTVSQNTHNDNKDRMSPINNSPITTENKCSSPQINQQHDKSDCMSSEARGEEIDNLDSSSTVCTKFVESVLTTTSDILQTSDGNKLSSICDNKNIETPLIHIEKENNILKERDDHYIKNPNEDSLSNNFNQTGVKAEIETNIDQFENKSEKIPIVVHIKNVESEPDNDVNHKTDTSIKVVPQNIDYLSPLNEEAETNLSLINPHDISHNQSLCQLETMNGEARPEFNLSAQNNTVLQHYQSKSTTRNSYFDLPINSDKKPNPECTSQETDPNFTFPNDVAERTEIDCQVSSVEKSLDCNLDSIAIKSKFEASNDVLELSENDCVLNNLKSNLQLSSDFVSPVNGQTKAIDKEADLSFNLPSLNKIEPDKSDSIVNFLPTDEKVKYVQEDHLPDAEAVSDDVASPNVLMLSPNSDLQSERFQQMIPSLEDSATKINSVMDSFEPIVGYQMDISARDEDHCEYSVQKAENPSESQIKPTLDKKEKCVNLEIKYLSYGSKEMYSPWIQKLIMFCEGHTNNVHKNDDENSYNNASVVQTNKIHAFCDFDNYQIVKGDTTNIFKAESSEQCMETVDPDDICLSNSGKDTVVDDCKVCEYDDEYQSEIANGEDFNGIDELCKKDTIECNYITSNTSNDICETSPDIQTSSFDNMKNGCDKQLTILNIKEKSCPLSDEVQKWESTSHFYGDPHNRWNEQLICSDGDEMSKKSFKEYDSDKKSRDQINKHLISNNITPQERSKQPNSINEDDDHNDTVSDHGIQICENNYTVPEPELTKHANKIFEPCNKGTEAPEHTEKQSNITFETSDKQSILFDETPKQMDNQFKSNIEEISDQWIKQSNCSDDEIFDQWDKTSNTNVEISEECDQQLVSNNITLEVCTDVTSNNKEILEQPNKDSKCKEEKSEQCDEYCEIMANEECTVVTSLDIQLNTRYTNNEELDNHDRQSNCKDQSSDQWDNQQTTFSLPSNNRSEEKDVNSDGKSNCCNYVKSSMVDVENVNISNNKRPPLKRSLSDSALNYNNTHQQNDENIQFMWPLKRRKINNIDNDILAQNLCNIIQSNRRNSISSICNEENVSFCILIDNSCIITEEDNDEQDKVCYTEIPEDCLAEMHNDDYKEDESIETVTEVEPTEHQENDYEYSVSSFVIESEDEKLEESWVEDVACVETVISDDIAEDIEISGPPSPQDDELSDNDESGVFSSSEHTDKVKYIYGDKMCNDDAQFVETLYNTPQMNVNKTLVQRETLITGEYYDNDSLEKILSESNDQQFSPYVPEYTEPVYSPGITDVKETIDNKENMEVECISLIQNKVPLDILGTSTSKFDHENVTFGPVVNESQDDTVHSCESSMDNVFTYKDNSENTKYITSSSPEVSSTTSEEKNSAILLKITNYKGSRISQLNDVSRDSKRPSCKFTEEKDYIQSQTKFSAHRPLLTKAAQKYIPPLKESMRDLKVKLSLPQKSLIKLKQLKKSKDEPKVPKNISVPNVSKKPKPKFEDVLKSIDEIQFKMHKEKTKKSKKSIPKVVIKKNENGSHYASTSNKDEFNPDLTGRKWQPWVFIEKNHFIDKMAIKNKTKAVYSHRKRTYVLAEKFQKYKSVNSAKFVISPPISNCPSTGLKYTIRLKHSY